MYLTLYLLYKKSLFLLMNLQTLTLVFATNNAHKAKEVEQILNQQFIIKTMAEIGCNVDIPEKADTLEGNSLIKARFLKEHYGVDCFSEDTGLEVAALNGQPGVHTARYAGDQKDPQANMDLLLQQLQGKSDRSAQFRTVIALIKDNQEVLLEGICKGRIATEKRGNGGFGYDPVFIPDGYNQSFAELGEEVKNEISHRAIATRKLVNLLLTENG